MYRYISDFLQISEICSNIVQAIGKV